MTREQLNAFREKINVHTLLHEDMKKFFEGYPPTAHPMAILSSMVASLSSFYPHADREGQVEVNIGLAFEIRDPATRQPVNLPAWRIFDRQYARKYAHALPATKAPPRWRATSTPRTRCWPRPSRPPCAATASRTPTNSSRR